MNDNRIQQALSRLFGSSRIVFWYDDKQEFREAFDTLVLAGVEKLEITNNQFSLKHQILREAPKQQFLLYLEDQEPEYLDNWLLDVQLGSAVFRTDQSAIWLSELNLPPEFSELVTEHAGFFEVGRAPKQAELRKERLTHLLKSDDTRSQIRMKMLAVCAELTQSADVKLDIICEALFDELLEKSQPCYQMIQQCKLTGFLWEQVERYYGYLADKPSVKDFSIELFKSSYLLSLANPKESDRATLNNDALVLFKRWKDSRKHQQVFEALSDDYAQMLDIEADLNNRDLKDVIELDYYQLIDKKVIVELVRAVDQRTLSEGEVTLHCRQRRQSHWYSHFQHLYAAIDMASQFLTRLDTLQLNMASSSDAVHGYVRHWFKIDQLYRKFIYHLNTSGQMTLLSKLTDKIESLYSNNYLSPLATQWQGQVDAMTNWSVADVPQQKQFYSRWVKPYRNKGNKICVIISDAFRYEAGEEMVSRIRQIDRYQASLDHMLSALPSYTQLGMASLLPSYNELTNSQASLSISDNKDGIVLLDSISTQGTANRDKLLKLALGETACALKAKQVLEMTQTEGRELFKNNDVIYIYHNRIDHAGDKMQSEGEAFEATERTFDDLMTLVKKLAGYNASNVLITADHGFIYQNRALEESDFVSTDVPGDIHYRDRRFLLGKNLTATDAVKVFSAPQLGLTGEVHAAIPKGIQRLRLSGSGSRFVHGGATLQEVIVPVIAINKKRQSDTATVEVDLLRGGTNVITAGQLSVTLYQTEPVTDKLRPRELRAGIYTLSGQLISDVHTVTMDLTAENARERELKLRFVLTQDADSANNQEVALKLEEPVEDTNQFKEYRQLKYTIRRSFTSDFDF
ncbi:BREX-1 system phosphatase PglZ type A [Shewanella sp. SG41-4]|uniref:BREX-1 system phosphatase PglZ type A n=1 Tax=Shewanella sp. SG41-4 TaxID=2760976 RepID=UPI001603BC0D|nr:BREX-1 system phosphatase PglZ type A [Shewanella sp. SG41-4]MBB1438396.1 BREX-1 system phosphatase PglZ type A [Shewanella sp. SG41-4]